ncbi:MAG: hypothetical protein A3G34_06190 [Candidatus Lindowbacteria bacterium RIFCSPLOWO2_12_FULL_62_27]|nr:MAG: hypothetical protein A3G34_06190 [Candidatus Lindowbacteria bacterium RIFCSPLOWO2_12_FULL_62_27]OGH58758.1 MAG: hypothetical protein A3I06_09570 [Candidatus Lindowbacteria bacterium RIFCSPLOWO2_02_FULL_62_12]
MVVEPIQGGQEVQKPQNIKNRGVEKRADAVDTSKTGDSVEISKTAREAASVQRAVDSVKAVPDLVRRERVEAARERILGGNYLSPKVVDEIAEKIANLLLK